MGSGRLIDRRARLAGVGQQNAGCCLPAGRTPRAGAVGRAAGARGGSPRAAPPCPLNKTSVVVARPRFGPARLAVRVPPGWVCASARLSCPAASCGAPAVAAAEPLSALIGGPCAAATAPTGPTPPAWVGRARPRWGPWARPQETPLDNRGRLCYYDLAGGSAWD